MLKPDFPNKGVGKEKWKERKGINEKKEKENDENKEKKRKDTRSKVEGKWKWKRAEANRIILGQWKKGNGKSSDQINSRQDKWLSAKENPFLVSLPFRLPFSTGDIPPHMNKEEKTETPSFLSKNTTLEKILLVRDRTCDLWFDRKSCAK